MYFLRLRDMSNTSLVSIAFQDHRRLHSLGFVTWYGKVCELARSYGIDLNHTNWSKTQIRHVIRSFFVRKWQESDADINKKTILRTYVRFKYSFGIESYLVNVRNPRYRAAISKLRTSSHALEVERGRHAKPKMPLEERLRPNCHVMEEEQHFVMECTLYETQRRVLINNMITLYPEFGNKNVNDALVFLLHSTDPNIQNLFTIFVYDAFQTKASHVAAQSG